MLGNEKNFYFLLFLKLFFLSAAKQSKFAYSMVSGSNKNGCTEI